MILAALPLHRYHADAQFCPNMNTVNIGCKEVQISVKKVKSTDIKPSKGDECVVIPWIVQGLEGRTATLNKGTSRNSFLVTKKGDNQPLIEDRLRQEAAERIIKRKLLIHQHQIEMTMAWSMQHIGWLFLASLEEKKQSRQEGTRYTSLKSNTYYLFCNPPSWDS